MIAYSEGILNPVGESRVTMYVRDNELP